VIDSTTPYADYPEGRTPGLLPRKSKPGQWCPRAADHIKIISSGDWEAAAKEMAGKLRAKVPVVLDQGQVGSCATEATAGAVMLARACAGQEHVLLNPWYIYRVTSGGSDSGSSIDDNLVFARENGIAPEALHPRSLGWHAKPSADAVEAAKLYRIDEFYDVETTNELVSCLLSGFAVVLGAKGHAILGIQHDGKQPLILNSWADDWEDHGFGYWCSYNSINWAYGCWAIRTAV